MAKPNEHISPPDQRRKDSGHRVFMLPTLVGLLAVTFVGLFVLISYEEVKRNTELRLRSAAKESAIALDMQLGHLFKDVTIMGSHHGIPELVRQELEVLHEIGQWNNLRVLLVDEEGEVLHSVASPFSPSPHLLRGMIQSVVSSAQPYLSAPFRLEDRWHVMLVMPRIDPAEFRSDRGRPSREYIRQTARFVVVAFATEDLARWLRGITLPEDSVTQLQRPGEGPWLRVWTGNTINDNNRLLPDLTGMMENIRRSGANSGFERSFDNVEGFSAWQRLDGLDLVLTVTMSRKLALAHWWEQYIWQLLFSFLAALFVTLASFFIAWTIMLSNRRRAEAAEALEQSEQRYRDLADSTSDWFWEIDRELKFRFVTSSIQDRIGIGPDILLNQRIDAFQDPEHGAAMRPDFAAEQAFRDYPLRLPRPDRDPVFIVLNGMPRFVVRDGQRVFAGYRGTATDVTEKRLAEEEARDARIRLINAIESIRDGFALFNGRDELILYNSSYADMLFPRQRSLTIGSRHEDLMRDFVNNQLLLTGQGDAGAWLEQRISLHREGGDNFVARLRDGRWMLTSDQRTPDGYYVSVHRDITDLKTREQKLIELGQENERLVAAMQASSAAVMIADPTLTGSPITFVNDSFLSQTGYSRDEVIGAGISITNGQETDEKTIRALRRSIAAGMPITAELKSYRKDGSTWWNRVNVAPVVGADGTVQAVIYVKSDISDMKRQQKELHLAKNEAEVANKTKSEFMAVMSHELRAPLNAIIGFSDILRHESFGPLGNPQYAEFSRDVNESAKHLLSLINDMLDLSKVEAGRMDLVEEPVDIDSVFSTTSAIVRERAFSSEVLLHIESARDMPPIMADERKIKQILVNLLTNAIKFTPEGGSVTMRARLDSQDGMVLTVTDNGVGIDEKDIEKVLTPYGQVSNPLANRNIGTGLGLPLACRLIELHGGTLELRSQPGEGTTVDVILPPSRILPFDPV